MGRSSFGVRLGAAVPSALLALVLAGCSIPLDRPATTAEQAPADQTPAATSVASTPAQPKPLPVVLVIDGSGSMATADMGGGATRMAAAQGAAREFMDRLPEDTPMALITYGDQTAEDAPLTSQACQDISLKVPVGNDRAGIRAAVDGLRPRGWTPISGALTKAGESIPDGRAHVVLITDGEDSCAPPDPCETAAALVAAHPDLVISTIGVRASSSQLACIAERGRGVYVTADSAAQLGTRLEAMRDPAYAAALLSPRGLARIRPGQKADDIRRGQPDFPAVAADAQVQVTWRGCRWLFAGGVLQSIALIEGRSIDGLAVGVPESALSVLGPPLRIAPIPGGGETRVYLADEVAGLGWSVDVKDGVVIGIALCTCLPKKSADWVPCAGAAWALEGRETLRGTGATMTVAMCEDGLRSYSNGQLSEPWRVQKKTTWGVDALSADDYIMLVIADARAETFFSTFSASSTSVRGMFEITRRYPDTHCAVTPAMRSALRQAGIPRADDSTLSALCLDGWAYLSSPDPGDSGMLLKADGAKWTFYTGFPSSKCEAEFSRAGGSAAFKDRFPPC
ncbi:VWA domain-containing protein [Ammonicoccus fulvus]|uniref:VWA domain-containing protein n=1 Tax=Ammonicoccus fulvus TaxID=3138240 RepID=A0ABZ3FJU8_9ACTN